MSRYTYQTLLLPCSHPPDSIGLLQCQDYHAAISYDVYIQHACCSSKVRIWQHAVNISNSNHWVGFLNESFDDIALSLNFYHICAIRKRFLTSTKAVSCTSPIIFQKLPTPPPRPPWRIDDSLFH